MRTQYVTYQSSWAQQPCRCFFTNIFKGATVNWKFLDSQGGKEFLSPPSPTPQRTLHGYLAFVLLTTENVRTDVGKTTSLIYQLIVISNKVLAENKVGQYHLFCSVKGGKGERERWVRERGWGRWREWERKRWQDKWYKVHDHLCLHTRNCTVLTQSLHHHFHFKDTPRTGSLLAMTTLWHHCTTHTHSILHLLVTLM